MDERGEVDGHRLRRSWPQLAAEVAARGRRLRFRRRAVRSLPVAAAVVTVVALVTVAAVRQDRGDTVRAGTAEGRSIDASIDASIDDLPAMAFARVYDGGRGGSAIFVTEPGGSGSRRLTPDPAWRDGAPAWSPDGRWIAFDSQRDNELRDIKTVIDVYLMRADGTDVRRVTTTTSPGAGNGSQHPSWSPDGDLLAIVTGDAAGVARIVVLRPDGTGARAITDGPGDVFPAWSPDGRWIAFQRQDAEVWVVRPDGSGARQIATTDRPTRLSWTPDGQSVTLAVGDRLVSMPVDGRDGTVIAGGSGQEGQVYDASWSSGGELIAYSSDPDGLYLVTDEPGVLTTTIGGPEPGAVVVAEPGGLDRRTLTFPRRGDSDVNATFAPG